MLESQDGWTVNDPLPEDPVSIELVMESVHSHPDLRQVRKAIWKWLSLFIRD